MDHILADGFAMVFQNGINVDPSVVPGSSRAPVRVIVTKEKLEQIRPSAAAEAPGAGQTPADGSTPAAGSIRASGSTCASGSTRATGNPDDCGVQNLALIEGTNLPITDAKLAEYLCAGGTLEITLDQAGNPLDVGREQRLFTTRQRTALALRDGGCLFPDCTAPPAWTEAHHIQEWNKHHGRTDTCNGILLCRYHHMLVHNLGYTITRDCNGMFWLTPPKRIDPSQRSIPMPSKNPLMRARQQAQDRQPTPQLV